MVKTRPVHQDIRACVFDAYGTLFDVHSAVARYRTALGPVADAVSAVWRSKQLEYSWLRSLMGRHADFWQITMDALDFALEQHQIGDAALRRHLCAAYFALDCYPEVPSVLQQLKAAGMPLAILSNGSPAMLQSAVAEARLEGLLDEVLSVEEVGVFKPDPRVYQLAVDRLNLAPGQISFQTANGWDAAGAAAFGLHVVWINRLGQVRERLPETPAAELESLAELPGLLGRGP